MERGKDNKSKDENRRKSIFDSFADGVANLFSSSNSDTSNSDTSNSDTSEEEATTPTKKKKRKPPTPARRKKPEGNRKTEQKLKLHIKLQETVSKQELDPVQIPEELEIKDKKEIQEIQEKQKTQKPEINISSLLNLLPLLVTDKVVNNTPEHTESESEPEPTPEPKENTIDRKKKQEPQETTRQNFPNTFMSSWNARFPHFFERVRQIKEERANKVVAAEPKPEEQKSEEPKSKENTIDRKKKQESQETTRQNFPNTFMSSWNARFPHFSERTKKIKQEKQKNNGKRPQSQL